MHIRVAKSLAVRKTGFSESADLKCVRYTRRQALHGLSRSRVRQPDDRRIAGHFDALDHGTT